MLGKASFNDAGKPLFIEALKANIFLNPSSVKCSLFFIISYADLNNK